MAISSSINDKDYKVIYRTDVNGVIEQTWLDVSTIKEWKSKYGSNAERVYKGNGRVGQVRTSAGKIEVLVVQKSDDQLATEAREKRDMLLAGSDYRIVSDAPWDIGPWKIYRQALREISEQETFPRVVVWPFEPS
jgi:hypothetical protein